MVLPIILIAAILAGAIWMQAERRANQRTYDRSYADTAYEHYEQTPMNGNEGALLRARSYLGISAFSYTGLIRQLEYEGFTTSEATYAADHCGADWNEQAVEKALSYLDLKSDWTRSSLIEQLEFEGFTYDQASYGVEHCGGF